MDVDALAVESFPTSDVDGARGTVELHTGESCGCQSLHCLDTDSDEGGGGYEYTVINCNTNYTCQASCRCTTDMTYCYQNTCIFTCGPQNTCQCPSGTCP